MSQVSTDAFWAAAREHGISPSDFADEFLTYLAASSPETLHQRLVVLPEGKPDDLFAWLKSHTGQDVEVLGRDGLAQAYLGEGVVGRISRAKFIQRIWAGVPAFTTTECVPPPERLKIALLVASVQCLREGFGVDADLQLIDGDDGPELFRFWKVTRWSSSAAKLGLKKARELDPEAGVGDEVGLKLDIDDEIEWPSLRLLMLAVQGVKELRPESLRQLDPVGTELAKRGGGWGQWLAHPSSGDLVEQVLRQLREQESTEDWAVYFKALYEADYYITNGGYSYLFNEGLADDGEFKRLHDAYAYFSWEVAAATLDTAKQMREEGHEVEELLGYRGSRQMIRVLAAWLRSNPNVLNGLTLAGVPASVPCALPTDADPAILEAWLERVDGSVIEMEQGLAITLDGNRNDLGWQLSCLGVAELCSRIRELSISDAELKTDDFASLASLTGLERLDLSGTSVGSLEEALTNISRLPGLRTLVLNQWPLTDANLDVLSKSESLRVLELDGTSVSGPGLKGFTRLERVTLRKARVEPVGLAQSLGAMTELRELDLSDTGVTDEIADGIRSLKELQSITLKNTQVGVETLKALASLPKLTFVSMQGVPISESMAEAFAELGSVEDLRMSDVCLNGRLGGALASLPKLEALEITNGVLEESGLLALRGMKQARSLYLIGKGATERIAESLQDALPDADVSCYSS